MSGQDDLQKPKTDLNAPVIFDPPATDDPDAPVDKDALSFLTTPIGKPKGWDGDDFAGMNIPGVNSETIQEGLKAGLAAFNSWLKNPGAFKPPYPFLGQVHSQNNSSGPNIHVPSIDTPFSGDSSELRAKLQQCYGTDLIPSAACVCLAMASVGIARGSGVMGSKVDQWIKGEAAASGELVRGTPICTFLNADGSPAAIYGGGVGGREGARVDHCGVFDHYVKDDHGNITGMAIFEQYKGSGGLEERVLPFSFNRFGEDNAMNYFAIKTTDGHHLGCGANAMETKSSAMVAKADAKPAKDLKASAPALGMLS